MGTSVHAQSNSESEYVKSVHEMCRIIVERGHSPIQIFETFYKFSSNYADEQRCLKVLHGYTKSVIESRKKEFSSTTEKEAVNNDNWDEKKRMAFLDLLLQVQKDQGLSDDEIRQEVDTFMFEVRFIYIFKYSGF